MSHWRTSDFTSVERLEISWKEFGQDLELRVHIEPEATGRGIAIPWNKHAGAASTIYGDLSLQTKRIEIIPALHGKLTRDGKLSEPDIYSILEKWLERHPTFKGRENEIRIVRGRMEPA